jgi:CheY-like chemotaxis protein
MAKILLVEDKEEHLASLDSMRKSGLEIVVTRDFVSATACLNKGKGPADYEAVLTDLMMPFGGKRGELVGFTYEGEDLRHKEQALGYGIAFCAAKIGVPLIGMVTDMNHHAGPVAGTFDMLYAIDDNAVGIGEGHKRPVFRINNSKLVMFDERDLEDLYLNKDGSVTSEYKYQTGQKEIKNWQAAYKMLKGIQ